MASTHVTEALDEITKSLAVIEPQQEGLYDFRRLNLLPPAKAEVEISIKLYERRVLALKEAQRVLQALVGDGYPLMAVREIAADAQADLAANAETIELALATFVTTAKATSLGLRGAASEQK